MNTPPNVYEEGDSGEVVQNLLFRETHVGIHLSDHVFLTTVKRTAKTDPTKARGMLIAFIAIQSISRSQRSQPHHT